MYKFRESFSTFNQWFAYSISILASVFFLIFEVTEEIGFLSNNFETMKLLRLIALIIAICGSGLSVMYNKMGAICMLAGSLGLMIFYLLQTPQQPHLAILYSIPYIVPSILLLLPKSKK
jgi:hypothetical protein